jgi:aminopeptidase N
VWAGGSVALVAALAFAYWTISPLFLSRSVNEAFPTSAAMADAKPTADAMMADAKPTADAMMADAKPTADAMMADAKPTADAMMADAKPTADAMMADAKPTADAMMAENVSLGSGSFTKIDALHGASGTATIYRLAEGKLVLRLESFNAQNGPDLVIGLSGNPMPRSSDEVKQGGYLQLASLKANQGNQNYELPADIDLSQYKSVVIYCRAFNVVFSTAELM